MWMPQLLTLAFRKEETHQHSTLNLETVAKKKKVFLPNFQKMTTSMPRTSKAVFGAFRDFANLPSKYCLVFL